jgi:hypothetical protein
MAVFYNPFMMILGMVCYWVYHITFDSCSVLPEKDIPKIFPEEYPKKKIPQVFPKCVP